MTGFKSWRSYWDFQKSVRKELRYVWSQDVQEFLDAVLATAKSRKASLRKDACLWRAQVGHAWRKQEQDGNVFEIPCGFSSARMKPLRDRARDGRVNAREIPCLYLSTQKETAMSEVRPWIGSLVSVAQFKLLKRVEIIACTDGLKSNWIYFEEPSPEKIEKAVWSSINRAFAEPMTRRDDAADYAATQIIAELFKRAGFGGVAYKSKFGEDGYNIALFDIDAAVMINCGLYEVDKINMEFSQQDNPYFVKKYYENKD